MSGFQSGNRRSALRYLFIRIVLPSFLFFFVFPTEAETVCKASRESSNTMPGTFAGHRIVDTISISKIPLIRRDLASIHKYKWELESLSEAIKALKEQDGSQDSVLRKDLALNAYEAIRAKHGYLFPDSLHPRIEDFQLSATSKPKKLWCECRHHELADDVEVPLFLLWHRAYVRAFEITANSVVQKRRGAAYKPFGIPYWNWVKNPEFPVDFRCEKPGVFSCQKPRDKEISCANEIKNQYENSLYSECRVPVTRTSEKIWTPLKGFNPMSISNHDFVRFSYDLESTWHDQIHSGVGGALTPDGKGDGFMGNPEKAVIDPSFWVHHSYVDKLMAIWVRAVNKSSKTGRRPVIFDEKAMRKRWESEKSIFPVICNDEVVWYQPKYDDIAPTLVPDPINPTAHLGYQYDDLSFAFDREIEKVPDITELVRQFDKLPLSNEADPCSNLVFKIQADRHYVVSKPAGCGRFLARPLGVIINLPISKLKLDELNSRARELQKNSKANLYTLSISLRRSLLVSLDGATLNSAPHAVSSYVLAARVCPKRSPCKSASAGWRFISTLGAFGIPKSLAVVDQSSVHVHGEDGVGGHPAQLFDVTQSVLKWLYESNFSVSGDAELEIAIVPGQIAESGTLKPVSYDLGLTFKSLSIWLKSGLEGKAQLQ